MRTLSALLALIPLVAQDPRPAWQDRLERYSSSPERWKQRQEEIRRQILFAGGLWPEFERPPLKAEVFGKVEGDGYTIERVRLETLPGFYLTGSLYRPRGKAGPFPGIAAPHGHWGQGRFTQTKDGNLPGRCLTFARLGFVSFMYDMVGYADFTQLKHAFQDPAWGMNLLGVQTWNSLRAVDFLTSLPDVDPKRIGASGASGGGTQTFLLAAVDDRIKAAAPVNMVAAEFQGGCSCENAPFLRLDLNNVEIAAATAPRPLLLISCTGDWTKHNPTLEGPAIQKAYKALGVEDRFRVVQFNAPHNYNQDSREAAYAWFTRWLQDGPARDRIPEPAFEPLKKEDLTAGPPPAGAVDAEGLKKLLREKVRSQLESLRPRDAGSFKRFRELMAPALRTLFGASWRPRPRQEGAGPARGTLFVVARPEDNPQAKFGAEYASLLLLKPHEPETPAGGNAQQLKGFPTCFYRTELARQVQDVLDALAELASRPGVRELRLVGVGEAGVPALFARALVPEGLVSLTVADTGGSDDSENYWTAVRPHPHLMRVGGLRTAASLAAPGRLVLHNLQGRFDTSPVLAAYEAAGAKDAVSISETDWNLARILEALK
jgi:dienelactone hydrolase